MKNERKKGAVLSYISIFINMLITLLYTPFMLKTIGQSEYGLYSMVSSIMQYLAVFDFGFGNAIIVFASKCRAKNDEEGEYKIYSIFSKVYKIISFITLFLCIIIYFNIQNIFGSAMTAFEIERCKIMVIILTINLCINFPMSLYDSIITINEKFVFQRSLTIARIISNPIIMLPLLILGYKSIAMTMVVAFINIVCNIIDYIYCRKKLNYKSKKYNFDWELFKTMFSYSFFIFVASVVDKLNWSTDQIILGSVCSTVAISIYTVATSFNNLFINFSGAINGVLLPKISKLVTTNNKPSVITQEFIKVGRIQFYVVFLMLTGLIIFGKDFIVLWVGEEYINSYYVALLLIVPLTIPLIQNLGLTILQAQNKYKFKSFVTFIMALINIIISIPLAKKFGPIGSALGTCISLVIVNIIIMNVYYYKIIKIDVITFWKNIFRLIIPLFIPIVMIALLKHYVFTRNYLYIVVYAGIYSAMYFVIAYLFCFNNYEKDILLNINRKLKKVLR
ncbi:hypothetical protein IV49_GL002081 [Kandleria vitulina DSM 20405]|uniref:Uncharacterized protein n=1 Tax=Kandleria vitulina DSM 20405 TaxID=1410657 RepID=A0A0R2HBR7_9FIRM|nr:oligosaccharide flippase family protein [Kandleria vitulina]KRN50433.1 hypothetical protein IV49_GL002081 [Kandleria vitulina DSM 20405]